MPEEINRLLTDAISDYLFITEESARINLLKEGRPAEKIYFVGNVMIDTLLNNLKKADRSQILSTLSLKPKDYALLTLHRPSNVDSKESFAGILNALEEIQKSIPIVYPIHPRARRRIREFGLEKRMIGISHLKAIKPLGYLDFLKLMKESKLVMTDSGGMQEETTVLGIPCLTLRRNTERPITVNMGTNVVVGNNPERIIEEANKILKGDVKEGRIPDLWDGKAAQRIVRILKDADFRRL
jgi:UDP-N-acetylglucosamine 2-epimerase (non-hydrolysing)